MVRDLLVNENVVTPEDLMVNENVVTPHRIKLCPELAGASAMSPARVHSPARLTIKPSRKYRTRKRIQLISPIKTENPDTLQQIIETAIKGEVKLAVKNRSKPLKNSNANSYVLNGVAAPQARPLRGAHRLSQSHKLTEYFDVDKSVTSPTAEATVRKAGSGKANGKVTVSHKLTEYYPVRRSVRKTSKCVLAEKRRDLETAIRERREEGLAVHMFEGKGRGVVATREFCRGDFVLEYEGELVSVPEARERELQYARDANTGCYMYYFRHGEQQYCPVSGREYCSGHLVLEYEGELVSVPEAQERELRYARDANTGCYTYYFRHGELQYCVDATAETGRLGRLVNHSRAGNLRTKSAWVDGAPHLVMLAARRIAPGDELLYDYGDRSRESLQHHPWLAL